jgi:hypothetical protein
VRLFMIFLVFLSFSTGSADPVQDQLDLTDCNIVGLFENLWRDSGYGHGFQQVEVASWVVRSGEIGRYEFVRWPHSAERKREIWRGRIPQDVIALIHPSRVAGEKPSQDDQNVAMKLRIYVYTISNSGVWVAEPNGKISKSADRDWRYMALGACGS